MPSLATARTASAEQALVALGRVAGNASPNEVVRVIVATTGARPDVVDALGWLAAVVARVTATDHLAGGWSGEFLLGHTRREASRS
jgi:hypothetical protein